MSITNHSPFWFLVFYFSKQPNRRPLQPRKPLLPPRTPRPATRTPPPSNSWCKAARCVICTAPFLGTVPYHRFVLLPTHLVGHYREPFYVMCPLIHERSVIFVPQVVAEQIPMLVQGVRGSQSQPESPSAQLSLISASQNFLQVAYFYRLISPCMV